MRAQRKLALVLCILLIHLGFLTHAWAVIGETPLSEEEKIIHLLNRLGFGPRPGDLERVGGMGIRAYIERQLHPHTISDPVVERKLAGFETLTMTPQQLNKFYPSHQLARDETGRGGMVSQHSDNLLSLFDPSGWDVVSQHPLVSSFM